MPFMEKNGTEVLQRVLAGGKLEMDDTPSLMADCKFIVLIVGTPVDEHLNPTFTRHAQGAREVPGSSARRADSDPAQHGLSRHLAAHAGLLAARGLAVNVAFCPERVAQGFSIEEFRSAAADHQRVRSRNLAEGEISFSATSPRNSWKWRRWRPSCAS
jgi:UDP-N-acetyl-D-mannosaminuronic acid dehydrogenase